VASGGEPADVADETQESCSGEEADAGDGAEEAHNRELFGHRLQTGLDFLDAPLDVANLVAGLGKYRPENVGQVRVCVLEEGPHRGHHLACAHRDEDAQLAQQSSQRVEARGSLSHPGRTHSVKRGQHLLIHSLHGDRMNVFVAAGLQDALGIGTISLVPSHIRTDVVRGQQDHAMAKVLNAASPEVRRTAGLHDHRRRRVVGEELQELRARQALPADDVPGAIRRRDLEDTLCHVHGDTSIVLHDGLLHALSKHRLWHIDADRVGGGVHLINAADEAGTSDEASPLICWTDAAWSTQPTTAVRFGKRWA
jgi:hypothetical protein